MVNVYVSSSFDYFSKSGVYIALVKINDEKIYLTEKIEKTSNNRLEMQGIIDALKYIAKNADEKKDICIYTKISYIVNTINNNWVRTWKKNAWKKRDGSEVSNIDLWEDITNISADYNIKCILLDDKDNEMNKLDNMAKEKIDSISNTPSDEIVDKVVIYTDGACSRKPRRRGVCRCYNLRR